MRNLRHHEIVAARMKQHEGCETLSVDSRQRQRAALRIECRKDINAKHGVEPRRVRRKLMHAMARNVWRDALAEANKIAA